MKKIIILGLGVAAFFIFWTGPRKISLKPENSLNLPMPML